MTHMFRCAVSSERDIEERRAEAGGGTPGSLTSLVLYTSVSPGLLKLSYSSFLASTWAMGLGTNLFYI